MEIIFIIITVLHAYWDSVRIKKHIPITGYDKFWRTLYWFGACMIPIVVTDLIETQEGLFSIKTIAIAVLIRMAIFDFALNKFRGLDWTYTSETTSSFIDQLYLKTGINANYIRFVSLAILIKYLIYEIFSN